MSLKAFHVVFVGACILVAMLVGGWGVREFLNSESVSGLALGILFFAFGFALLGYGLRFVRKMEELGI